MHLKYTSLPGAAWWLILEFSLVMQLLPQPLGNGYFCLHCWIYCKKVVVTCAYPGEIVTIKGGGGSVLWLPSCQDLPAGMATNSSGEGTQQTLPQLQVHSWDNGQQIHSFEFLILDSCWWCLQATQSKDAELQGMNDHVDEYGNCLWKRVKRIEYL